jgi:hypothetical protein
VAIADAQERHSAAISDCHISGQTQFIFSDCNQPLKLQTLQHYVARAAAAVSTIDAKEWDLDINNDCHISGWPQAQCGYNCTQPLRLKIL